MNKEKKSEFQNFIVENKFDQQAIEWSYIKDESKSIIEDKVKEIEEFIKDNSEFKSYDEEKKDSLFKELMENKYIQLKDSIKNAWYKFDISGDEFSFVKDFAMSMCEYDASSVYFGIHLDATLFNRFGDKKYAPQDKLNFEILSGESVLLYEIMCKKTVKGIKSDAYIFASVLRKLAECAKIYNHFDGLSASTFKKIQEWNMGLSADEIQQFKETIAVKMANEIVEESSK